MFMKKCLILLAVALSAALSVQAQTEIRDKQPVAVAVSSEQMGVLTIVNNSGKATRFAIYSLTGQVVKVVELKTVRLTSLCPVVSILSEARTAHRRLLSMMSRLYKY